MSKKKAVKKEKKVEKAEKVVEKVERKIDHKTWILVCFAIIALIIVTVVILNFMLNEKIDSCYFHDGNSKIVSTMDKDSAALEDSIYEPNITHVVYYHDGTNITGAKAFYEYKDEEEAKEAYPHLGLGDFADNKKLNGRFVVFQVKKDLYDGLTVDKVKHSQELLKQINALILDYSDNYIERYSALDFNVTEDSDIIEDNE